ncbi:hypothetical protein O181_059296 [Austropuccinia psidii MF-1]|uniref:Integrase catalytic domain-containing protein n=1 Tax=Austropuccinia psidii MF-1 TaxID=1389203 RepID=A0A9Q3HVK1_9BASI|nr:hypothetical protein [Austropuccinia psidii MF-1]
MLQNTAKHVTDVKMKTEPQERYWNDDPNSRTEISLGNSSHGLGTALPPEGDINYNACLVLVDRYRKTPVFIPCHKYYTAMETAIMICNKCISHTGLFQYIISDRDPK